MERAEYEHMYRAEETHWWFASRRSLAETLLERHLAGGRPRRMLDVGCGTGGNLAFLAGWAGGSGIDLSPVALSLARRRRLSRLAQASALELPFADRSFELVTAFDVFYHRWIADDSRAIGECYRVLRPGGWLLLTDSALPGLWSPHDDRYYARERYTLDEIERKLSRAGFEVCASSYTRALLLPFFAAARLMMRWLPLNSTFDLQPAPAWLNRLLIRIHGLEQSWLRRGGTLPLGSSLICIAKKRGGEETNQRRSEEAKKRSNELVSVRREA